MRMIDENEYRWMMRQIGRIERFEAEARKQKARADGLEIEKNALEKSNGELVQQLQTAGTDANAKQVISDVLKLASDALLTSTTAEDTANVAKTDAVKFVKAADAAVIKANNSDVGSAAALAAENAAKEAKKAQKDVGKEVGKVQKASSDIENLARTFFADASKVTENQKTKLNPTL